MSKFNIGDKVLVEVKLEGINSDGNYYVNATDDWKKVFDVAPNSIHSIQEKTYDDGVKDGMNQGWELARKINDLLESDLAEIFDGEENPYHILNDYAPIEANEKIKSWEENTKIRVGDIAHFKDRNKDVFLVTQIDDGYCYLLFPDGVMGEAEIHDIVRTGHTIDINALLKQIVDAKEDEN